MKKIFFALVITLTVALIGQAWLSERRHRIATTAKNTPRTGAKAAKSGTKTGSATDETQSTDEQAANAEAAESAAPEAVAQEPKRELVDLRGKGKIAPEEVVEAIAEEGVTRLSAEREEEERERKGRKKGRYQYVGRVSKFSRQEATGANLAVVNDEPTQQTMKQSGRSFFGDLRNLPQSKPVKQERFEREGPDPAPRTLGNVTEALNFPNFSVRVAVPTAPAPAPSASFPGLDFNTWGNGHPPDTVGDVGPTHYIQSINSSIGIYDKATGSQLTALTLNNFMSQGAFGNQCDNRNFGDPVILYDTFEDRWVITDFAFTVDGGGNVTPAEAFQCVAVSRNSNPVTGGWNFYSIRLADGLNDYPKFGVWPDGIYMSANMFGFAAGGGFLGTRAWALNKAQMYAGQPTAQVVSFNPPAGDFTLLPSNARLQTGTPPAGAPNYFVSTWQFTNALTVYKFKVDWNRLSLSTFTGPDTPLAATSWPNANVANAPSLGGNSLDVLPIRAMMQNQYTNIGGAESLWATHTIRRGNTTGFAAPRWYQVNVTGGTVAANLPQAATWDPDAANVIHRFMPSLAVNRNGDLALGYSTSSSTTKPAIKYAGRLATDPVNTFSQTEQVLIQGAGTQTGNCGGGPCARWGDYSAMSLAPDGCTFWYTNMYYDVDGLNHQTRIGSFTFPSCTPVSTGTVEGTVTATMGGAPIGGATITFGSRTATTNGAGFYQFLNVPSGTYPTITASAAGYTSSTASNIAVTDGNTTTQNFMLNNAAAAGCLTDTTTSDFQLGLQSNVDLTAPADSVTLSNAPVLDQSNLAGTTIGTQFTATSWGGQTFTAGVSGPLVKADVQLFCIGCTGTTPNINVSIRATSAGLPTGADLATAVLPGFSSGSSVFHTVTFATPTTVTAGTQYALILAPTANPSPGTGYFWIRASPSSYAAGQRVTTTNSGVTWATDSTRDFNFRTYIQVGYPASGTQTSNTKDANPPIGATPTWTTLSWTATTPASTDLKFQVAASNSAIGPFTFVGPDNTAATFFTTSGASLSQFNGFRYLQYKAFLSSSNNTVTPTLSDVTVCYNNITGVMSGGGTVCAGASANVVVTVIGGTAPFTVTLTNGGGTQTGAGPVFTFPVTPAMTTTYAVAAGSVDGGSNPINGSGSATVTVNPLPATPTITPGGPTTFCTGGSVMLTSSAASSYLWSNGAMTQSITVSAGGNYSVTVTDGNGCMATSALTTVTVNAIPATPTITPGGPTTFCAGGNVSLSSSSASGNQWYLNGNPIGGATNQAFSATTSGNYTVVVTALGCSSAPAAPTTVTVNPLPDATITPNPLQVCATSIGNTASGPAGVATYAWTITNGAITSAANIQNITYTAGTSGNVTLSLTTTSAAGCSNNSSVMVPINALPSAPIITPSPTQVCGNSTGNTASGPAGATTYAWTITNGTITAGMTSQNVTYTAGATGNVGLMLTVTNAAGCSATNSISVPGNTAPTLTYSNPAALVFGNGTTVNPVTGPTDNGTISSIVVQNAGTYTGTINVNNATGVVTISNAAPVGTHTITIRTTDNCGVFTDAPFQLTVNKANTLTTIVSDTPDPSVFGQSYVVAFTVTAVAPGAGTPTGNVTVSDGTNNCTATVVAGSCSLPSTSVGAKTLTATYAGNASFNTSASATALHTVNQAGTATTLVSSSPSPSVIGQSYTVTMSLAVTAPGAGSPTGTVTVSDGTNSCTITLPATSCQLPSTSVGAKTLTATYAGDSNYASSTAASLAHTVNKGNTTLTITSSSNPSTAGSPVTFTITVAPIAPAAGTPTGTVQLKDNGTPLGAPVTVSLTSANSKEIESTEPSFMLLANGVASLTTSALTVGSHLITADYVGDASFNGSSASAGSGAVAQMVLTNTDPAPSDQKAGSVLVYNYYTSTIDAARQNTRLSITNTHVTAQAFVHLFFVDGSNCSVADSYICLTPNQTASFLASDLDPGTSGYVIAVATDRTGCPIDFNFLIGDEYVKLATGHQANLGAEAIAAIAGGMPACDATSSTAELRFNGVSYNFLPRTLALSSFGSPADGNNTLLVVNRIGGNLATGAASVGSLFGLLYDDAERAYSFSLSSSGCQLRGSLSGTFPRTTPRIESIVGSGRSGWLRLSSSIDGGIFGAAINFNANAASNTGAFTQGHNLHKLTLSAAASVTLPVFPPTC